MEEGKKSILTSVSVIYIIISILFVVILVKATVLKTSDKAFWEDIQKQRIVQMHSFSAQRGNIYAQDPTSGELLLLASDEQRYNIYLDLGKGKINAKGEKTKIDWIIPDTAWNKGFDNLCKTLAKQFPQKTLAEYKTILQKGRKTKSRYVPLLSMITEDELKELKSIKMISKAIISESKYKRIYPYGDMARRTIGIETKNDSNSKSGFTGIDGYYDTVLKGVSGTRLERKISPELWIPVDENLSIKPINGDDIITTIDVSLQELAETALMKCLDSNDAEQGTVILMETKTGYVKAMASFTRIKDGTYFENENIAATSSFEPGSTFKTVTAMLLLDKGLADTGDFVPTGMKEFRGASKPIYDVNKRGPADTVSFCRAMEISSNVGISYLAYDNYRTNRGQFAKDLQQYFYYDVLNLDMNIKEPKPIIRSSENMDDMLRMSFGYVTMMTPLQLLTFYNAIANNGVMLQPKFVKYVLHDGKIVKTFEPKVIKEQICKPETLEKIQIILRRVVQYGTGRRLRNASYGIAGKSGTAEIDYFKGSVESKFRKHRASFAGYFPADNPQYSCIVVISAPQKALTHGGDLAAPVFRELSDRVIGVSAQNTRATGGREKTEVKKTVGKNYYTDKNREISEVLKKDEVPDVRGWSVSDAVYCLEALGMKVSFSGYGYVVNQSVSPKTKIRQGQKIILTLKHGNQ